MFNGFNVPRERETQTFYGMMDNFFEALSQSIDAEKAKIQEEVEAYKKADETKHTGKQGEIHVHIHTGAAKKKDPKAKVRNRGKVVFPAGSKKVKDDKDHFPINSMNQARNALSRVAQYDSVPSWYSGSLSELQKSVRSAVKRAYPDIEVTEPKKKKK